MFVSKRLLKKDKIKKKHTTLIFVLIVVLLLLAGIKLIYLNFSFGKVTFISPVAKDTISKITFLEKLLDQDGILITNINTEADGSLRLHLKDGGEVILSSKKDLRSQISSLQLILSRLTIEGKKLKVLDFRFNRPVISF